MTLSFKWLACILAATLVSPIAHAHRMWIKPSTTSISELGEWVTFDAAVANPIFSPDHFPLKHELIRATDPNNQAVSLQNPANLHYRSVFDLALTQEGTYRVFLERQNAVAFWKDAEGKRGSFPRRGAQASLNEVINAVPKDAQEFSITDSYRRVETFITSGKPSKTALNPSNKGLELNAKLHPADIYTNEAVTFGFLMNGKAAKNASVTIVREGEKYRDSVENIEKTTNEKGEASVRFSQPGMYWMEVEYQSNNAEKPYTRQSGTYILVFEVFAA